MVKDWRARRLSRRYVLLFASLLAVLAFAATASGNLTGSTFDGGDGNLVVNDEAKDWANVGIDCVAPGIVGCALDEPTGSTDDSFGEGTSENDDPPSVVDGSIPNNKSDLTRFYVSNEKAGGKDFLYLAWERVQEPSGTTNMDFEFNKGSTLSPNGVTQTREQGDLLIKYDLSQGGTNPTLGFHRWQTQLGNPTATTPSARGDICEAGNKFPCWGKVVPLGDNNFEGAVNTVAADDPIDPGATRSLSPRTFGEAAINLTDSGLFPVGQCTSFGSGYLKSRSSDSFTAAVKDFIAPIPVNISNCGTITITKEATPEDGTDFSFTDNIPAPCAVGPLDDDADSTLSNTVTCSNVQAGTYTVTEEGETGWSLTDITCADPTNNSTDSGSTATIVLAADETVSCTFTNKEQATVEVIKVASPQDGTNFVFGQTGLGSPASFTLDDDANDTGDGTGGDFSDRKTYTLPGTSFSSGNVSASVSETLVNEWTLTGRACTGTTTANSGNNGLSFSVAPGDTITCTFTNVKDATVTIVKAATPKGGTDFGYTGDFGSFTLEDDGNEADEPGVPGTGGDWPKSKSFTLLGSDFPAGGGTLTKSVSETIPTDWDLTDITCLGGGANTSDTGSTATIGVDPGEAITCTYTNVKDAKVTIVKEASPDSGIDFGFTGGLGAFTLEDDGNEADEPGTPGTGGDWPKSISFTFQGSALAAGALTRIVDETVPGGWTLFGIVCTGGGANTSENDVTATIGIDPGEDITCTFTNRSKHVVIVLVCHQGTNTLHESGVQIDPAAGATKQSLAQGATLPDGVSEAELCGLGGARFEDLNHVTDRPFDVTIPATGH